MHSETRVAVIFHRLGPYHWARLQAAGGRMKILAVEAFAEQKTYPWDRIEGAASFERVTLSSSTLAEIEIAAFERSMDTALDRFRPDCVAVPGWIDREALAGLSWCQRRRVPAIVMSETTAWDNPRSWWKESVKRRIVGFCSSALAGGRPHAAYLEELGLPAERIFCGYDAVDNAYFESGAREARAGRATTPEGGHDLPPVFFLASARFVEKKNLPRLLQAYARYQSLTRQSPWPLVLLGDGPLRATLEEQIARFRLQSCVILPGFRQYPELPAYFGRAGAFIHASTAEQWGLVVNEAMASGLPVLISNRCGCAQDLVQAGENGFTFDPLDTVALAELMRTLSEMKPPARALMGERSRAIIAEWGPDRFADGLAFAAAAALQRGVPETSSLDRTLLRLLLRR